MDGIFFSLIIVAVGIILVILGVLFEEWHTAKRSGKKIYNLKALREDLRRIEEKEQHIAEAAARRADRTRTREDTINIRELVDDLDRDARTSATPDDVPTIHVRHQ